MNILINQGFEISLTDARDIAKYIENRGYGKITWYPLGRAIIDANFNAVDFVNKLSNMTFDQKIRLIYFELSTLPDKKGKLEEILDRLGIDHNPHIIREFTDHFKETGHLAVFAPNKDFTEVILNQKGQDYLHAAEISVQPNIVIENYHHSIVNKGGNISQSGVFESGIKRDNNSTTNNPITNPTPSPNPNSPTRKIQRWQLIIGIVAILAAIILAILKKYGIL